MACTGYLQIFTASLKTSLTSDRLTSEAQTRYGCDKRVELEVRKTAIAGDKYIIMMRHTGARRKLAVVSTATGHVNPHIRCEWPWTAARLQ